MKKASRAFQFSILHVSRLHVSRFAPRSLTSCDQKRLHFPQFFAGFARSSWGICSDRKRFISTGASAANDALSVLEKDPQGNAPMRIGGRSMAGAKTLDGDTDADGNTAGSASGRPPLTPRGARGAT